MLNKRMSLRSSARAAMLALSLVCMFALNTSSAAAQSRRDVERLGGKMVDIQVGEITLESIDFRDQTARLNVGLDIRNGLLPVSLKDFDYSLRLFDQQFVEGRHDGTLKVGGRKLSRVNLPLVVNLRSIPNMVWSAFSNRGQVRYELDTAFTLPLFIMERRFDQSFSGEVPLRSLVDAASILRASRLGSGSGNYRLGGWNF